MVVVPCSFFFIFTFFLGQYFHFPLTPHTTDRRLLQSQSQGDIALQGSRDYITEMLLAKESADAAKKSEEEEKAEELKARLETKRRKKAARRRKKKRGGKVGGAPETRRGGARGRHASIYAWEMDKGRSSAHKMGAGAGGASSVEDSILSEEFTFQVVLNREEYHHLMARKRVRQQAEDFKAKVKAEATMKQAALKKSGGARRGSPNTSSRAAQGDQASLNESAFIHSATPYIERSEISGYLYRGDSKAKWVGDRNFTA